MMIDFTDAPNFGREEGLKKALAMLHAFRSSEDVVIVETGTTRGSLGGGVKGDGWATLAFGWYCKKYGGSTFTIDKMEEAIAESQRITSDYADWITYQAADSVEYLRKFDKMIDLLYLDSLNDPAHIENELKAVYSLLNHNAVVVVDDTDPHSGKGLFVAKFLKEKGWNITYINSTRQLTAIRSGLSRKGRGERTIYFGIGGQYGDILMQEPSLRKLINDNPDAEFIVGCSKRYSAILPVFYHYHPQVVGHKIWDAYRLRPEEFSDNDKKYIEEMNFEKMYSSVGSHTRGDWYRYHHQVREMGLMLGVDIESDKIQLNKYFEVNRRPGTVAVSLIPADGQNEPRTVGTQRACEIVKFVKDMGFEVVHLNGPNEPDIGGAKANVSYFESIKLMLGTDLLITSDTGMSWAASAYDHPVVGLYGFGYWPGSTSATWKPLNPNAEYLESRLAKDIPLDSVFEVLKAKLKG